MTLNINVFAVLVEFCCCLKAHTALIWPRQLLWKGKTAALQLRKLKHSRLCFSFKDMVLIKHMHTSKVWHPTQFIGTQINLYLVSWTWCLHCASWEITSFCAWLSNTYNRVWISGSVISGENAFLHFLVHCSKLACHKLLISLPRIIQMGYHRKVGLIRWLFKENYHFLIFWHINLFIAGGLCGQFIWASPRAAC